MMLALRTLPKRTKYLNSVFNNRIKISPLSTHKILYNFVEENHSSVISGFQHPFGMDTFSPLAKAFELVWVGKLFKKRLNCQDVGE